MVDEVAEQVRELIVSGKFAPGQQLLQYEIAEQLGISRTPLREAFRVLERDGLVRTSNGNMTLEVVNLTPPEMVWLYEFREVIDGLAARCAAERGIDAKTSAKLHSLLDDLERLRGKPAPRGVVHAEFHSTIAQCSGNPHVIAQIPMIRLTAQMLARRVAELNLTSKRLSEDMTEEGSADHRRVLEAIEAGDGREAELRARAHIRKTRQSPLLKVDPT